MKKYFNSYWIQSAFYSFFQRIALTVLGLANFMILIRCLTKPEMGTWALFLTVTTLFETSKSGLLKNAHIKYVSGILESNEKTIIASSSLLINGCISLVFILVILILSDQAKHFSWINAPLISMLKWYIPGLVFVVLFSHFEAIQQSHFDFKGVFAGNLVRQIVFFVIIIIHFVLKTPLNTSQLAIYQSFSIIAGVVVIYFYSRKYLLFRFDPSVKWVRKIAGYGGYIFGSGLISNIYANVDQLLMSTYTLSSVAYYNAASRINNFVEIPSYAASEILFPKVAKASAEEGVTKVAYLYEKMVAILLSFTVPFGIFILLFPKWVIGIIAGHSYLSAAPILRLYILVSMISPLQNQAANVLNSTGRAALSFKMNAASLIAKVIIAYTCLLYFGFYGAAIGTFIASSLTVFCWCIVMNKTIHSGILQIIRNIADFYKSSYSNMLILLAKIR